MLTAFVHAFRTPDLRKKILFVLFIIVLFRLGSTMPAPGINVGNVKDSVDAATNGDNSSLFALINVFSGGTILQHVEGHAGAGWGSGRPATHPLRLVPRTRLAELLGDGDPAATLEVNAYHHQGIRRSDLAPGLRAAAWADSSAGPLVEGLESETDQFVVGVQCHPERVDSTPESFERLFAAFVAEAARNGVPTTG